jgi:aconitate hydratase
VDDRQILPPSAARTHLQMAFKRGPNIQPPPKQVALPDALEARVLIVVGDDISTGDLSPDGAEVMAFRSNVPAMANFVFRRIDPEFPQRAKQHHGGMIVGGRNYGQGSSREHAALAPKYLGVRVVLAKSFARIHRRNLIAQGIVPLLFASDDDYQKAKRDQVWQFPELRRELEAGEERVTARLPGGETLQLTAALSQRERELLLVGGLLASLRTKNRARGGEASVQHA